jgi:hypothetical protein
MSEYQPSYQAAPQQTHTMALVSLIFGILGLIGMCPGLGSIVAIITGGMAKNEIRADPVRYTGEGLAQAGVIMGWIGVALMVLALCAFAAWLLFVFVIVGTSGFEGSFHLVPGLAGWVRAVLG